MLRLDVLSLVEVDGEVHPIRALGPKHVLGQKKAEGLFARCSVFVSCGEVLEGGGNWFNL